jgi:hypothetical protein
MYRLRAPAASVDPLRAASAADPGPTTSANLKYYTGLKLGSNSHFDGRAAAEEVLADFLSALLRPERASHANAAGMANGAPAQLLRRMRPWTTWTGVVRLSIRWAAVASRAGEPILHGREPT